MLVFSGHAGTTPPVLAETLRCVTLCLLLAASQCLSAQSTGQGLDDGFDFAFDDQPRDTMVEYPDWFKPSFLDMPEDINEVVRARKKGLIVYFGQMHCAYCHTFINVNLQLPDIANYMQQNFDVVPLNIWDVQSVTDMHGNTMSARELSIRERTNFTPSLIFYDTSGREVFRLRGYYPPYKFRAALEYVADRHYLRMSFRDYLRLADFAALSNEGGLNENPMFMPPPYALDRSRYPAQRPLVVFFEQPACHTCDVLHAETISSDRVQELLGRFEKVQLDMWSDVRVITPRGEKTTARQWAAGLGLFFAPSMVFFDENGNEVFRVDSLVRLFRLTNVLEYVLEKGYKEAPTFAIWRARQFLRGGPAAFE